MIVQSERNEKKLKELSTTVSVHKFSNRKMGNLDFLLVFNFSKLIFSNWIQNNSLCTQSFLGIFLFVKVR